MGTEQEQAVIAAARAFSVTEAKINITRLIEDVIRDTRVGQLDNTDPPNRAAWTVTIGLRNSPEWLALTRALAALDGVELDELGELPVSDD